MAGILETPYNITSIINSSSLGNLFTGIAPVLNGYWLGNAFLLIIFLVTLLYLKGTQKYLNRSCVVAALSLTMMSAIFLFIMEMIAATMLWWLVFLWIFILIIIAVTSSG